jgi:uncharacterized membrane protein
MTEAMPPPPGDFAAWAMFACAFGVFLLSHVVPTRPAVRARLCAVLGDRGFPWVYSLVSVLVLAWLIAAAGWAPYVPLWAFAPWQMWVPNVLMPFACLLVAFGAGAANPLSFGGRSPGGRSAGFDPCRPGVAGIARHPLLLALALWAGGHVVPNGDLAHVLLFGTFAVFSVAGMLAIDVRRHRSLGGAAWRRLAARTSLVPLSALVTGRWRPGLRIDPVRLGAAAALYVALLALHPRVIGVSPL